jgi:F420-non-reducing hydrogenase iron-sulfur subunit
MEMNRPVVAAFCCPGALAARDRAVEEGRELPEGLAIVELPCTGRIDEVNILHALRMGAWAVMVVGCLEGNCEFHSGNFQAQRRVDQAKDILVEIGVDRARIEMFRVASNQGQRFAELASAMAAKASSLGPIKLQEGSK